MQQHCKYDDDGALQGSELQATPLSFTIHGFTPRNTLRQGGGFPYTIHKRAEHTDTASTQGHVCVKVAHMFIIIHTKARGLGVD